MVQLLHHCLVKLADRWDNQVTVRGCRWGFGEACRLQHVLIESGLFVDLVNDMQSSGSCDFG